MDYQVLQAKEARKITEESREEVVKEIQGKLQKDANYGKFWRILQDCIVSACKEGRTSTSLKMEGSPSLNQVRSDLEKLGFECSWHFGLDGERRFIDINWS